MKMENNSLPKMLESHQVEWTSQEEYRIKFEFPEQMETIMEYQYVSSNSGNVPSTSEKLNSDKIAEEEKSLIQDLERNSAPLIFRWLTGFLVMKLGKAAAFTMGSGIIAIIALQLANSRGYVNINWDNLIRGVKKVAEQVVAHVENSTSDKTKELL